MRKLNPDINPWQNKAWLEEQYFKNKLSFNKMGQLVGKTGKTIEYFFKKYGLKSRPPILGLKGNSHPRWKGGRSYDQHGYVRKFHPEPHLYKAKHLPYVLEHILVAEEKLGRPLKRPEVVHHNDGVKDNNHPDNLTVFPTPKAHNDFEWQLNLFIKQVLHGNLAPDLKTELQSIFKDFRNSLVKER